MHSTLCTVENFTDKLSSFPCVRRAVPREFKFKTLSQVSKLSLVVRSCQCPAWVYSRDYKPWRHVGAPRRPAPHLHQSPSLLQHLRDFHHLFPSGAHVVTWFTKAVNPLLRIALRRRSGTGFLYGYSIVEYGKDGGTWRGVGRQWQRVGWEGTHILRKAQYVMDTVRGIPRTRHIRYPSATLYTFPLSFICTPSDIVHM